MPQHEDLNLLRPLRTTKKNNKLEQTADHPISEGQALKQQTPSTHPSTLSRSNGADLLPPVPSAGRARRSGRASFWDPHLEVDRVDRAGRPDLVDELRRPGRLRVELEAHTGGTGEPPAHRLDRRLLAEAKRVDEAHRLRLQPEHVMQRACGCRKLRRRCSVEVVAVGGGWLSL